MGGHACRVGPCSQELSPAVRSRDIGATSASPSHSDSSLLGSLRGFHRHREWGVLCPRSSGWDRDRLDGGREPRPLSRFPRRAGIPGFSLPRRLLNAAGGGTGGREALVCRGGKGGVGRSWAGSAPPLPEVGRGAAREGALGAAESGFRARATQGAGRSREPARRGRCQRRLCSPQEGRAAARAQRPVASAEPGRSAPSGLGQTREMEPR